MAGFSYGQVRKDAPREEPGKAEDAIGAKPPLLERIRRGIGSLKGTVAAVSIAAGVSGCALNTAGFGEEQDDGGVQTEDVVDPPDVDEDEREIRDDGRDADVEEDVAPDEAADETEDDSSGPDADADVEEDAGESDVEDVPEIEETPDAEESFDYEPEADVVDEGIEEVPDAEEAEVPTDVPVEDAAEEVDPGPICPGTTVATLTAAFFEGLWNPTESNYSVMITSVRRDTGGQPFEATVDIGCASGYPVIISGETFVFRTPRSFDRSPQEGLILTYVLNGEDVIPTTYIGTFSTAAP